MKIKTYGYIENDKLHLIRRDEWLKSALRLKRKKDKRTRVLLTIERATKKRSLNQNAYYWGVVIPSLIDAYYEATGELLEHQKAHELLKYQFCRKQITNEKTGETFETIGTTTDMSTLEFEEYQEKCRAWVSDFFGVVIPLPNEQGKIFE